MVKFKYILWVYPCIVSLCISVAYSFRDPPYFIPSNSQKKFVLFKDVVSILMYFEEQRASFPVEVDTVLRAYHDCFFTADVPRSSGLRRPFIVIEGKDRKLRETIARMLAETMGARYLITPPKCLSSLIHIFQKGSLIRNAFFALSLYPAAFNARQLLSLGTPVVMNGYWTEQASYVIDKLYRRSRDLPPAGSWIYDNPRDLMMPDMLFYLRDKYAPALDYFTTVSPMWRTKMVTIYSKFRNIPVTLIDLSQGAQQTVESMYDKMRKALGDEFDFSPAIPYEMEVI